MKKDAIQAVADRIYQELMRAEMLHPNWPEDVVHAAAIVGEEAGELLRAALQHRYQHGRIDNVITEAIQTAAMAFRFLLHVEISDL